jgi:hypothetical protein
MLNDSDRDTKGYRTEYLTKTATEIQKDLYNILPSCGQKDYEERVIPHRDCIDKTIWIPITGKPLLQLVRDYFQREGIHCHTSEALEYQATCFVEFITGTDTSRFAEFLTWGIKEDAHLLDKIQHAIQNPTCYPVR